MTLAPTHDVLWDADAAVEELYAAHYRRLLRLSVLLVRDVETAEKVVLESFVAMHARWRSLQDPGQGVAYLRHAVVNRSRSILGRRRGSPAYLPGTACGAGGRGSERRAAVLGALHALPE